ncbi:unnamed protein product, partial [Vitis vinifera]
MKSPSLILQQFSCALSVFAPHGMFCWYTPHWSSARHKNPSCSKLI